MITLRKVELELVFLISIVAFASIFFVIHRNNQFNVPIVSVNSPLPTRAPSQSIFSQISPDGTKKVIMKIVHNKDDTQTFSFYTTEDSSNGEQFIFSKTLDVMKTMTIPFNAWSSDNQYFFIQENAKSENSIFAFKASGVAFSEKEEYLDVTDLFKKKDTGNNFSEATGWASESLIIINTTKKNGTKGPSYWFEIPSRAIIELSTKF